MSVEIEPTGVGDVSGYLPKHADYGKRFDAAESVDGVADTVARPLEGNFNQILKLTQPNPSLRVLISPGGWTGSYRFSNAALPADRGAFVALLAEFRRQLDALGQANGRQYLLSIAAPAGAGQNSKVDLPGVAQHVDRIDVMAYDFHGGWETSGHGRAARQVRERGRRLRGARGQGVAVIPGRGHGNALGLLRQHVLAHRRSAAAS